jgi:hypothetical protein
MLHATLVSHLSLLYNFPCHASSFFYYLLYNKDGMPSQVGGLREYVSKRKENIPAFFSCSVNSAQFVFILSLSAIHRSACSCGGMPSHRFSMFASVGLEMACACRCWTAGTHRTIVALGAAPARRRLVRSIVGRVEECVLE